MISDGISAKTPKQNWKYFNIMQDVETLQHQNNTVVVFLGSVLVNPATVW